MEINCTRGIESFTPSIKNAFKRSGNNRKTFRVELSGMLQFSNVFSLVVLIDKRRFPF